MWLVMAGLVPAIHVFPKFSALRAALGYESIFGLQAEV
jgi:hypothetical protein